MSYSWGASRRGVVTESWPSPAVGAGGPGGPNADRAEMSRVAAELAPMVEVWERLIAQHIPDRSGRCRTCTEGGTGRLATPWPCTVYGVAEMARRRHGRTVRR